VDVQLIRHTPCTLTGRACYGHLDVPLPETAPEAIAQTLQQVRPVEIVFTSPLLRCLVLATQLAQRDHCQLVSDPDLRELDFGEWEGSSWEQISRATSDHWAEDTWNRAPPGGESEQALYLRVQRSHRAMLDHGARRIAVVAHGGSLRLLRCLLLQQPVEERWHWRIEPGEVHTLPSTAPPLLRSARHN
jgi:alpha-ribazole phosphatase